MNWFKAFFKALGEGAKNPKASRNTNWYLVSLFLFGGALLYLLTRDAAPPPLEWQGEDQFRHAYFSVFALLFCAMFVCWLNVIDISKSFKIDIATPVILFSYAIFGSALTLGALMVAAYLWAMHYQYSEQTKTTKNKARPEFVTALEAVLTFGVAFALADAVPFWKESTLSPLNMVMKLTLILSIQTVLAFFAATFYYHLLDDAPFRKTAQDQWPSSYMLVQGLHILLLPWLAFVGIVFWSFNLLLAAALLLIPLLFFRWPLNKVSRIADEISNVIETIVQVIEEKDPYTRHHCNRVAFYAMAIGKVGGLPAALIERIRRAGPMHDIGKIFLPDRILKKEGGFSDEEYAKAKEHTDPHKVLMNKIPDGHPMKEFIELGRHHHERFDGRGYPDGLSGEEIPIEVRCISMADAWDAMTSHRVYRKAKTREAALEEVRKFSGQQWDSQVVETFRFAEEHNFISEVVKNPSIIDDPVYDWVAANPALKYRPRKAKIPPRKKIIDILKHFIKESRLIIFLSMIGIIFASLFEVKRSPFHGNHLLYYAALAVLFEFLEIKVEKFPRFHPVTAVYLATLFVMPLKTVIMLILLNQLLRIACSAKIEFASFLQGLNRIPLFALSVPFFLWMGLGVRGTLIVPRMHLENLYEFSFLVLIFFFWGILYAFADWALSALETLIRRGVWSWKVWYLPNLKSALAFESAFTVPFGILLIAAHYVNPAYQFFPFFGLGLTAVMSFLLLNRFLKIIQGNTVILEAIDDVAEKRFPFYEGHSNSVAWLICEISKKLGLTDEEIEIMKRAAKLFALGNVGVPDKILNKEGSLTDEEFACARERSKKSEEIAAAYSFYKEALPIVRSQFERWDGTGPLNQSGEAIPLGARILAVADAFIAMISDRPYRKSLPVETAVNEIIKRKATRFDPQVVEAFVKVLSQKPGRTSNPMTDLLRGDSAARVSPSPLHNSA